MSQYFEFEAYNIEEALAQAEQELQIAREDFRYSVVENVEGHSALIRVFLEAEDSHSWKSQEMPYKPWGALVDEEEDVQLVLLFIQKIASYLDVELSGYFLREDSPSEIYLDLQCPYPGMLIGKGGKTLESLRILSSIHLAQDFKMNDIATPKRIFQIDIQGYLRKRFDSLRREVDRAAEKARRNRKGVLLKEELPPGERRQIHMYVKTLPQIYSESQGEGFLKSILISFQEFERDGNS